MKRSIFVGLACLAACASPPDKTAAERRFDAMFKARDEDGRFPVLSPLPGAQEVVAEGIPPETEEALYAARAELTAFRRRVPGPERGSTEEVAAELRALIARARSLPPPKPPVDIEALGFPTPPPLTD